MNSKSSLLYFEIISFIFAYIFGTLLHFTYEISNNNLVVASFSAINESTWEHLKLLFFPIFITTIIGYLYFKNKYSNYLCIKVKSIILGLSFIVIFFYTYTGILGKNIAIIDILSFFVALFIAHYYSYKMMNNYKTCNKNLSLIILLLIFSCFIVFTYFPPKIGLFIDPLTNTYGFFNNK